MKGILIVKLDGASHQELAQKAEHPTVHAHHHTIRFGCKEEDAKPLLGRRVTIKVTGIASDHAGQAVRVEEIPGLPYNRQPHVTISCAEGVAPAYSNILLATAGAVTPFSMELSGELDFIPFTGKPTS